MLPAYTTVSYGRNNHLPAARPPSLADEEDPGDYAPGGYLNVKVADAFSSPNQSSPYIIIRKLGYGFV